MRKTMLLTAGLATVLGIAAMAHAGTAFEQAGGNEQGDWLNNVSAPAPVAVLKTTQSGNCGGRLADIRPKWDAYDLGRACTESDTECVISVAKSHPGWDSYDLGRACKR